MQNDKRISPQAIRALKEALAVIYWKKEDLQDFVKQTIHNQMIVGTINWSVTKREAVKELIERMVNRPDIYQSDLMCLLLAVTDFEDFGSLEYFDEDGSKKKKAKEAVSVLRNLTKGYIQKTAEQEESQKRKVEAEKSIIKNKSFRDELQLLKDRFMKMAANKDLQARGYALETFLYDLFTLYELDPKGSFKIHGEQIDGAFTFQGNDYLLEAKWKRQVGMGDLAAFCHKVDTKLKSAMGLMVTMEGVTAEAISPFFKSIIIMDAPDLIAVLDGRISLPDLLFLKRRKASETGEIYLRINDII